MNTNLDVEVIQSSPVVFKTIIGQANDLALEHEYFNDHYIVAGRKALYGLLGKIYALSEQLNKAVDREDQVAIMRRELASRHGIRTQENTSDTTVLVRYITCADRKTAHIYSRAIEAARANAIASTEFADYVEGAGGIERIRANAAISNGVNQDAVNDAEEMLQLARMYLDARSELPITSFRLPNNTLEISSNSRLSYFACYERNGRYYVLSQMPVDLKQEVNLIEDLSEVFCAKLSIAKKNVNKFHAKAMAKRRERTIREITKKRPALSAKMRTTFSGAMK
jgi:hypothetical protein